MAKQPVGIQQILEQLEDIRRIIGVGKKPKAKERRYTRAPGRVSTVKTINAKAKLDQATTQRKFQQATQVMYELRCCEGVVDPNTTKAFYVINYKKGDGVWVGRHIVGMGNVLAPAYATDRFARKAVETVGLARVERAFKTLMFIK